MNKMLKRLLVIVNLLLLLALIFSIFVPSYEKKAEYSNTDVSSTNRKDIPTVGIITNTRNISLSFDLYNEEFYGICLFFSAEGEDENGEIVCTLQFDGQEIAKEVISVRELFAKMRASSLSAREIFSENGEKRSGKYTILLQGNEISSDTRISLYGNDSTWKYLKMENDAYQEFYGPLYLVEVIGEEHPHIWSVAFILTLSLLFSYLIYRNDKEKGIGAIRKDKKI